MREPNVCDPRSTAQKRPYSVIEHAIRMLPAPVAAVEREHVRVHVVRVHAATVPRTEDVLSSCTVVDLGSRVFGASRRRKSVMGPSAARVARGGRRRV